MSVLEAIGVRRLPADIKRSLDALLARTDLNKNARHDLEELLIDVERLRIRHRLKVGYGEFPSVKALGLILRAAERSADLEEILLKGRFKFMVSGTSKRALGYDQREELARLSEENFLYVCRELYDELSTEIDEEIDRIIDEIHNFEEDADVEVESARKLRNLIPEQSLSPLSFEIESEKVVVAESARGTPNLSESSAEALHLQLVSDTSTFLDELKNSNCDPRMLKRFEDLHDRLCENSNPISIGISNISASLMTTNFSQELPDAIVAAAASVHQGISMYLGQFPEWREFSETAAGVEIDTRVEEVTLSAALEVVGELEREPELCDPEVPASLRYLINAIKQPGTSVKRAVFALIRSLENLIAVSWRFGSDLVEQTFTKSVERISDGVSRALAITAFTVVLGGATTLLSVSGIVGELHWIGPAKELVERNLSSLR